MIKQKLVNKVIGAVGILCVTVSAFAQVQWVDQTEVIVNDEVILKSDVDAALNERLSALRAQNQFFQSSDIPVIRKTVLEELIERSILVQRAKRIGVSVSDQMLNEEILGIATRNNLTLAQFVGAIEQQGQDYVRYRENIREQIMIQLLVRYEVGNKIRVSDSQAQRVLSAQLSQQVTDPEYLLLHKRFDTKEAAQEYVSLLTDEGLSADESVTNLGYRKRDKLPVEFFNSLQDMQKGDVSEVIERADSFHIIQILDVKGDAKQSVTQHLTRHVLIMPNELRTKEQALELITSLHQRVLDGEDFGEIAKEFSDDSGSAALSGSLGWTDGSEMVPQFRDAMPKGEINEVSPIFETSYGYHFLQVTQRRQKDLFEENLKNIVKQDIGDKAFQDEYPRWLADLKSTAYIKYSNESDVDYQLNRIKEEDE